MIAKDKRLSPQDAVKLIHDGATIATCGFSLVGVAESIMRQIEKSFIETSHPRDLTLFHAAGQSDRQNGIEHLAHSGLLKCVIGSHWGLAPKIGKLINDNEVAGYAIPQGQAVHLFRAIAAGKPGNVSAIGLETFIDPRIEGAMMNDRAQKEGPLVELVKIQNRDYLLYHAVPIDIAIIRGTTADEEGNITTEEEAIKLEALSIAQSAKRYGGTVIAQVKNYVPFGKLKARDVTIPSIFVDHIVIPSNPKEEHIQTVSAFFDPTFTGAERTANEKFPPLPMTVRKVIGRRGVRELFPNAVVNLGTGIPGDTIGPVADEENVLSKITLTVESGTIGGVPLGGTDFGVTKNPHALIEHGYQFDYYNGTGVDITFMGVAETDIEGNVNVSKIGPRALGCGGFIDITQCARKVVFLFTFTAGGLEVTAGNGKLKIIKEGQHKKFLKKVAQITFSGELSRSKAQPVVFVTERAVFNLTKEGLELIEYAPGVDLQKDILDKMGFKPIISDNLKLMPEEIFKPEPMGFEKIFGKAESS